jgi:UDP-N-acetylglucosamine 3-dehydrogenase
MNVAVVGAGFAGGIHAQAWAELGAGSLLVVDADAERARAVAERWGARASTAVGDALGPAIDTVSVCLPTAFHADVTLGAVRAGKHVLCEKPMAMSADEAERMIEAAADAGVTLMVAHVLRFWPEYDVLGELVTTRRLGGLRALSCYRLVTRPGDYAPWLLDPEQGLGLGEVMIHDLDIAAFLLGRPSAIVAHGVRDGSGWAHLQALLRYEADVTVSVEAGWGTPAAEPFVAGFRAVFEEGLAEYDSRRRPTLRIVAGGRVEESESPGGETEGGPWAFDVAGYLREVEYFSACVRDGVPPDRCPPDDARQALELVLAAMEAARSGEEIEL